MDEIDERIMNLQTILSCLRDVSESFTESYKDTCGECGMTRYTDKKEWIQKRDVDTIMSRVTKLLRTMESS